MNFHGTGMKYIISIFFVILLAGIWLLLDVNYDQLNPVQKFVAQRIYQKWDNKINALPPDERALADYDNLLRDLSIFERIFVKRIFSINPMKLGFKGPFYSTEKPIKLLRIESVKLNTPLKETVTGIQYFPEEGYRDFLKMSDDLFRTSGRKLYIGSGYRSPGRQAYLFFKYLVTSSSFSLKENAKWIAMPGYSEHGNPVNTSADFVNENGINGISDGQSADDFAKLPEYKWLLQNAEKYNFHLSYPRNNRFGVAFEPWHWHWKN